MLTYKKLLPKGIVGRHTLANQDKYRDEESEERESEVDGTEYDESTIGDVNNPDANGEFWSPPPTADEPVESSMVQRRESKDAGTGLEGPEALGGYGHHAHHPHLALPIDSEISSSRSQDAFTRVSTVSPTTAKYHAKMADFAQTKALIDESRYLSKKRAPGIETRMHPLRTQSSGISQYSFARGSSSSGVIPGGTATTTNHGFSPLRLNRVYGRNDKIGILNLTGLHYSHIVYTASNVVVLFDFYHNQQRMLQGHKNKITCLAKDSQNRHFATGDVGPGSVIIIWDISTGYPFRTFPVSQGDGDYGVISIAFVGDEGYIGSIGNEMRYAEETENKFKLVGLHQLHVNYMNPVTNLEDEDLESISEEEIKGQQPHAPQQQNICIWHLSQHEGQLHHEGDHHHHHEKAGGKPAAVFTIPSFVGHQREIVFCDERPEFFVTTGDRYVVFYTWLKHEKIITHHVPKRAMKFMSKINKFTQSIWMKNTKWCLTGTDVGFVVAWATPIPLGLQAPPDPRLNIKEYKRAFKVGDCAVTSIVSHKDLFLIGDERGVIKFFDTKFRIIRWTKSNPQMALRPITCISCNQCEGLPDFKKEMQEHFDQRRDHKQIIKDWTYGGQKFRQPSQTTIDKPAFFAPDFIIGCEGGDVHYCHLAEGKADQIVFGTPGIVVAMDTCPNTTHVTTCTKDGEIQMYDYTTNNLIFSGSIFKKLVEVSCMKFHPSGAFAFFGMKNGQLYFRRAYTWKSIEAPLDNCTSCIERIVFSNNGAYMAHYDTSFVVTLYGDNVQRNTWVLRGKHRAHYRTIVDLIFYRDEINNRERLFSLGQDKYLIEYDVYTSTQATGLKMLCRYPIDTEFVPTSFVVERPWKEHKLILMIANTGNKLKFFDQDIREVRKYCQGPTYGSSVNRMLAVRPERLNGRDSPFILMTLGSKLGLMKTPIDGNPYKYMAVLGHPGGIHQISIGCSGKEIFTSGDQDDCLFEWEPNIAALETCVLSGGSGIGPYLKMLDAGLPPGRSLAEDVENVFYHLLIRRAKTQQEMLGMKLEIPIIDIPLVLRTCGTFLTEYQNELIIEEALELGIVRDGETPKMISFEDFVKLFANYKEFPPVMEDEVVESFHILGELNEDDELFIGREKFVECISRHGEKIYENQLPFFLPTLYQTKEQVPVFEQNGPPAWFDLIDTSQLPPEQQEALASVPNPVVGETEKQVELNGEKPTEDLDEPAQGVGTTASALKVQSTTSARRKSVAVEETLLNNDRNQLGIEGSQAQVSGKPSRAEIASTTHGRLSDVSMLSVASSFLSAISNQSVQGIKTRHHHHHHHRSRATSATSEASCSEDSIEQPVDYSFLQFGGEVGGEGDEGGPQAEETDPDFIDKELPEEISLEFFLEEIVPTEAFETMQWTPPTKDEKRELQEIYAANPDRTTWNDIAERWRYRDEWRYFRGTFGLIRKDDVPLEEKLARAVEMDHYARVGAWPENFQENEMEEWAGEGEEEEDEEGEGEWEEESESSGSQESTSSEEGKVQTKHQPKKSQPRISARPSLRPSFGPRMGIPRSSRAEPKPPRLSQMRPSLAHHDGMKERKSVSVKFGQQPSILNISPSKIGQLGETSSADGVKPRASQIINNVPRKSTMKRISMAQRHAENTDTEDNADDVFGNVRDD